MAVVTIQIAKVVGGGICVAASDGNKVHDEILALSEELWAKVGDGMKE
jgi:hypothetical protein